MHGNVWEWCADHWHGNYAGAPADGSAWLDVEGGAAARVLRGGSWLHEARGVRSACRYHSDPAFRIDFFGFRCARVQ
jgi:formylglycine-generating enzyme required for sulfatase activity